MQKLSDEFNSLSHHTGKQMDKTVYIGTERSWGKSYLTFSEITRFPPKNRSQLSLPSPVLGGKNLQGGRFPS